MFDFDKVNQRRGTGCVKWDNDRDGVIPMWVADMDFAAPQPVRRLKDSSRDVILRMRVFIVASYVLQARSSTGRST